MSGNDLLAWLSKQPNVMVVNEAGQSRVGIPLTDGRSVAREWFTGSNPAEAMTTAAISLDNR